MYATFGSARTGDVGPTLGPFPFAQLTYDSLRAGVAQGDAYIIAIYDRATAEWRLGPERDLAADKGGPQARIDGQRIDHDPSTWNPYLGTLWTDVTLHNELEDALA